MIGLEWLSVIVFAVSAACYIGGWADGYYTGCTEDKYRKERK